MNAANAKSSVHHASATPMGHLPALDGLRAISILLVLFSHANFQFGDNGILGVDIFFALSGFLITTLLLEEYQKHHKISLAAFYVRRTLRLFPALYVLLIIIMLYAWIYNTGDRFTDQMYEVLSSALYVNNISWSWGWADKGLLLSHTWSLAVEEQFYILWPFILMAGLYFKQLKWLMMGLFILIAAVFFLKINGSLSGVYGSLIQESIYFGCAAALVRWKYGHLIKIPDIVTLSLVLFLLIVGIMPLHWYKDLHDAGGRSIISFIAAVAIIPLSCRQNKLTARLLSLSPMVWIGRISYSLYLWHVPVFKVFKYHSTLPASVSFVLKFVVTFILAFLSYLLIEKKTTDWGRTISKRIMSKPGQQ